MHKSRYNALRLSLAISPRAPLLIKAGDISGDPSLPDMQFVRTYRADLGETVYLPGSSLKGAVRSFVERVLRTLGDQQSWRWACPTFPSDDASCAKRLEKEGESWQIYRRSCGACRTFGHTRLRGRLAFTDFFPSGDVVTEVRHAVAISRLSHAVAQGPFDIETTVAGTFTGHLVLENYEVWQLGLVSLALQSMNNGLLKLGFGKNRGFGEVQVEVREVEIDEARVGDWRPTSRRLRGSGAFVDDEERGKYGLAPPWQLEDLPEPIRTEDLGLYARRIYDAERWIVVRDRCLDAISS